MGIRVRLIICNALKDFNQTWYYCWPPPVGDVAIIIGISNLGQCHMEFFCAIWCLAHNLLLP